jgi:acyl-CoA reductase-like NAD-dependent aldehyde dehydrogenase
MFVGGAWAAAESGETFTAESPATGEAIGEVPHGARADAQRAVAAANDAANGWARLTAFERAALMHRVGDEIEKRRDELAHVLTSTRASPCTSRATRSTSSSRTGETQPRTGSASKAVLRTRSRPGSASCSFAGLGA